MIRGVFLLIIIVTVLVMSGYANENILSEFPSMLSNPSNSYDSNSLKTGLWYESDDWFDVLTTYYEGKKNGPEWIQSKRDGFVHIINYRNDSIFGFILTINLENGFSIVTDIKPIIDFTFEESCRFCYQGHYYDWNRNGVAKIENSVVFDDNWGIDDVEIGIVKQFDSNGVRVIRNLGSHIPKEDRSTVEYRRYVPDEDREINSISVSDQQQFSDCGNMTFMTFDAANLYDWMGRRMGFWADTLNSEQILITDYRIGRRNGLQWIRPVDGQQHPNDFEIRFFQNDSLKDFIIGINNGGEYYSYLGVKSIADFEAPDSNYVYQGYRTSYSKTGMRMNEGYEIFGEDRNEFCQRVGVWKIYDTAGNLSIVNYGDGSSEISDTNDDTETLPGQFMPPSETIFRIPLNLSPYPAGIYVVSATNSQYNAAERIVKI